ncbi:NAD(P)/FAD-dependent oxidoreductase [Nocardia sp. CA-129566]|uniref:NAD(P)/FAD-dependent oxidoreductase n=1 Tax=Nocardia sp. CA-129566 TaxID=3239976 RepID=UPI003D96FE5E
MTGQHRIVILGGGYAGLAAARRLARIAREAHIAVVDARANFVERVRLHQYAVGQSIQEWDLRELLEPKRIQFVRARANGIDTASKQVILDDARTLDYDSLIYALGSTNDADVPGVAEHAYSVATPEDSQWLRTAIPAGRIVVVGCGATGIELAAELAEYQPDSQVVLLGSEAPASWLSRRAQQHVERALERLGVEIRSEAKVIEVTPDGVRLADGSALAAAATVWTAGFGVPDLARRAGLAVDGHGRVLTDATLRSISHPDVYAAGDAAVVAGPGGRDLRMACATALPTGKYAADALVARLAGSQPRELRFRYYFQCISLGRRDGVVQFLHHDDAPARTVLTGRTAAWFKEQIVQGAGRAARP